MRGRNDRGESHESSEQLEGVPPKHRRKTWTTLQADQIQNPTNLDFTLRHPCSPPHFVNFIPLILTSLAQAALYRARKGKGESLRHHWRLHPRHERQSHPLKIPSSRAHPIFLKRSPEHEGEKHTRERLMAGGQNNPEVRSQRSHPTLDWSHLRIG